MKIIKEDIKLGKFIGSGSYKRCYAIKGKPGLVALKVTGTQLCETHPFKAMALREVHGLDMLRRNGIPAVKPIKLIQDSKGDIYIIQRKYHGDARDEQDIPKNQRANALKSVRKILRAVNKSKIGVRDLQFLVSKKGYIRIADPLKVSRNHYRSTRNDLEIFENELLNTIYPGKYKKQYDCCSECG